MREIDFLWEDPHGDAGWFDQDQIDEMKPCWCHYRGYLVKETKDHYLVAPSFNDGLPMDVNMIPKRVTKNVKIGKNVSSPK